MECFLNINEVYIENKLKRTKECSEAVASAVAAGTAAGSRLTKQQSLKIGKNLSDIIDRIQSINTIESLESIGVLVEQLMLLNETFDPNLGLTDIYMNQMKSNIDTLIYRLCVIFEQVLQYSNQIQILPGCSHHYIQSTINLVIQFMSDLFESRYRPENEISDKTLEKLISTLLPCYHYSLVQTRCRSPAASTATTLSFHSIYLFMNHFIIVPISTQRPSLFDPTTVACTLLKIFRAFKNHDYEPVPKKNNLFADPFMHCSKELVERYLNHLLSCKPAFLERNIAFDELFFEFYLIFEAYDYENQLPNAIKAFLIEIFRRQKTRAWNHFVLIDRECKNDQSVQLIAFLKDAGFKRSYSKPEGEERSLTKSVLERTTRRNNRQLSTNNNGTTVNGKRKRSQ